MEDNITVLKGVGPAVLAKFAQLGIKTIAQLIDYFPRRYDDYSHLQTISMLTPGTVTLKVKITSASGRYVRRGMHITEALASDATGSVRLVWFNQPYRAGAIKTGADYYLSGEFGLHGTRMSITNPSIENADSMPLHTARIVPIYKETKGISSLVIRKAVFTAFLHIKGLPETLPSWVIIQQKLVSRAEAVKSIHFPASSEALNAARHRLGFEEVFQLTLAALLNKQANNQEKSLKIPFNEALAKKFVKALPYKLSDDQRLVLWQIFLDIQSATPMNRLVEGDVGSGKTVVAAMAAAMAMDKGYQVAYMAPTEILARQHAVTLYELMQSLQAHTGVGLLIGGLTNAEKLTAKHLSLLEW